MFTRTTRVTCRAASMHRIVPTVQLNMTPHHITQSLASCSPYRYITTRFLSPRNSDHVWGLLRFAFQVSKGTRFVLTTRPILYFRACKQKQRMVASVHRGGGRAPAVILHLIVSLRNVELFSKSYSQSHFSSSFVSISAFLPHF